MRLVLLTLVFSVLTISTVFQKVQSKTLETKEIKSSATKADNFLRISIEDAKKEYDAGTAVIVDARSEDSFKAEHIKGAMSIPYGDFDKKYKSIPANKKIIVYCSCPSEATSGLFVEKLNEKKITNAFALTGGTNAWKTAGYPMGKSN